MLKPTHLSSVSTVNVLALAEKNKRHTSPKARIGLHKPGKVFGLINEMVGALSMFFFSFLPKISCTLLEGYFYYA